MIESCVRSISYPQTDAGASWETRTRFSFARENADLRNFSYRRSCIGVKPAVTSSPALRVYTCAV